MPLFSIHDRQGGVLAEPVPVRQVTSRLVPLGIDVGRWTLAEQAVSSLPQLTYARDLLALQQRYGAHRTDRVRWRPGQTHSDLKRYWLEPSEEHVHDAREVRVVLDGRVRFQLRLASIDGYASIVCEAGDWIALPAGVAHACEPVPGQAAEMLRLFEGPQAAVSRRAAPAGPAGLKPMAADGLAWAWRMAA